MIPERPLLKPWFRLAKAGDGLVLEYGHKAAVLEGAATARLVPALLPLLDGTRTVRELVATLGEPVEPAVLNVLELLDRHGLLTDPFPDDEHPARAVGATADFLSSVTAGLTRGSASTSVAAARVGVAGSGPAAEEAARLLRLSGVGDVARVSFEQPSPEVGLSLVAPEPSELPAVAIWNEAALEAKAPWLGVLPFDGRFAGVGPLVVPGETCCYECYRLRRASNLGYYDEYWALERVTASAPQAPAVVAATVGLAVVIALRWLVERDPRLPGVLFALELAEAPALAAHHVYRVPRCPRCSEAARLAAVLPWYEDEGA